jgi:hypothetical protein
MITWPDEDALNEAAKRHMAAFKKTAAARELEEDEHTWVFHSWARMPDPPVRMLLQDETPPNGGPRQRVMVVLNEGGTWTMKRSE